MEMDLLIYQKPSQCQAQQWFLSIQIPKKIDIPTDSYPQADKYGHYLC